MTNTPTNEMDLQGVPSRLRQRMDELEPVAIYAGHLFDVYQP